MPGPITASQQRRLEQAARAAAQAAHAPYSRFKVGAAVLTAGRRIFTGCNVENASYGLCICAERTAVFSAVAAGERRIVAVAVCTPTAAPKLPCGACRQVIHEFGPQALVIGICRSAQRREMPIAQLLPGAFGPGDLLKASRRRSARKPPQIRAGHPSSSAPRRR